MKLDPDNIKIFLKILFFNLMEINQREEVRNSVEYLFNIFAQLTANLKSKFIRIVLNI